MTRYPLAGTPTDEVRRLLLRFLRENVRRCRRCGAYPRSLRLLPAAREGGPLGSVLALLRCSRCRRSWPITAWDLVPPPGIAHTARGRAGDDAGTDDPRSAWLAAA